ncbi:hypothetical protein chiPu_0013052 [Chiloscyllium punctatum]|uniref:Uncharacterized protein n=1 Tax=Chiloscyllium punctatum TaxID=137246 RepID=A0A401SVZ9_CHIPU|nr:hypothetical protein [Chiloscyllium punctatum]
MLRTPTGTAPAHRPPCPIGQADPKPSIPRGVSTNRRAERMRSLGRCTDHARDYKWRSMNGSFSFPSENAENEAGWRER